MLGLRIKAKTNYEWSEFLNNAKPARSNNPNSYRQQFPWHIKSKIRTPVGTPRETASAFFQLKLGHGYIKSYLKRLGHVSDDRCRCGRRETTHHLLLTCPELSQARQIMKEKLNSELSIPLLLHSTLGIEATLQFLQTTRICTRQWHLQRREEDSEDEEEGEGE
jgi:hypothetical protein